MIKREEIYPDPETVSKLYSEPWGLLPCRNVFGPPPFTTVRVDSLLPYPIAPEAVVNSLDSNHFNCYGVDKWGQI